MGSQVQWAQAVSSAKCIAESEQSKGKHWQVLLAAVVLGSLGLMGSNSSFAAEADTATVGAADAATASAATGPVKCVSNVPDDYKGKVWQIGTDNAFAPFAYVDANGELKGIDVELFAAIAKNQNIKYRMCSDDFSGLLTELNDGKYDGAMAGISFTVKRAQYFDFSKRYYNSAVAVVMPQDMTKVLTSVEAVQDKTVAVKDGTLGMDLAKGLQERQKIEIKTYTNTADSMQAVESGEADCLLEDYPVAVYELMSGKYPSLVIAVPRLPNIGKSESYHFLVPKNNKDAQQLLQSFNQGLDQMITNGTYKQVIEKYLPEVPASLLSSDKPNIVIKPEVVKEGSEL